MAGTQIEAFSSEFWLWKDSSTGIHLNAHFELIDDFLLFEVGVPEYTFGRISIGDIAWALGVVKEKTEVFRHGLYFIERGVFHGSTFTTDDAIKILRCPLVLANSNELASACRDYLARSGENFHSVREPKPTPESAWGYVYIAQCETGHIKIGISENPVLRIKHFDTQMPVEVRMMYHFPADDAREAESYLHKLLGEYRQKGEWFVLPPLVLAHLTRIEGYIGGVMFFARLHTCGVRYSDELMKPQLIPFQKVAN
jgi:hypothetical protein